jgi:hypothetical protein
MYRVWIVYTGVGQRRDKELMTEEEFQDMVQLLPLEGDSILFYVPEGNLLRALDFVGARILMGDEVDLLCG